MWPFKKKETVEVIHWACGPSDKDVINAIRRHDKECLFWWDFRKMHIHNRVVGSITTISLSELKTLRKILNDVFSDDDE